VAQQVLNHALQQVRVPQADTALGEPQLDLWRGWQLTAQRGRNARDQLAEISCQETERQLIRGRLMRHGQKVFEAVQRSANRVAYAPDPNQQPGFVRLAAGAQV